ncbi:MAG: hypothetical protein LBC86_00045 [Oscillospiraceae bacterium]|jgi:hypothetical protein|nr:hypothetical protein [Oscillospiraceae bacterium]
MEKIKLGYSRPLRMAANSRVVELLGETTRPQEVAAYDHLECTFYEVSGSGSQAVLEGKYEIRLSLTSESENVAVSGIFTDENGNPLGCEFKQAYQNIRGLVHSGEFKFSKPTAKDKIYLSLTAEYISQDSPQIVTQTVQAAVNDDKFDITLIHPTKRSSSAPLEEERYYGNPEGVQGEGVQGGGNFKTDSEHILIALLRTPQDTSDIDYLCGYGRTKYNNPYLGLPGKAILQCKDGGSFVECVSAYCYLYDVANAGGAMVQAAFSTDSGEGGKIIDVQGIGSQISYTMPRDRKSMEGAWKNRGEAVIYNRKAEWEQTKFHYEMKFVLKFDISNNTNNPHYKFYEVIITSRKDASFSKSAGSDYLTVFNNGEVLPLKLMYGCLGENTIVLCDRGFLLPIKSIKIGAMILSSGEKKVRVCNVWKGHENMLLKISFGGKSIMMTPSHPVLTPNGYVKADSLIVGSEVCALEGYSRETVTLVTAVEKIEGRQFSVYNIDTEDNLPFVAEGIFVGTNRTQNSIIRGR